MGAWQQSPPAAMEEDGAEVVTFRLLRDVLAPDVREGWLIRGGLGWSRARGADGDNAGEADGVGASALLFPNDRPARDPPTQGLLERLRFSGSGLRPAEFAVSARGCVDESNPIDRNSPANDISRRTRT